MDALYPTLTACAERLLGAYFRQVDTLEELGAREIAAEEAIKRLRDRRISELRTRQDIERNRKMEKPPGV